MEELYKLIPDEYADAIRTRLFADKLNELRIRNGFPVRVSYDGSYYFLGKSGISKSRADAFTASPNAAEDVIMRSCEHSLYTVTDTIKRGYIAARGGIRIGVCGNAVTHGGEILTVKNFTSVNIRLPHEIKGCAQALADKISTCDTVKNTLVISPPGAGKTTVVRDVARILSERNYNVLLCDEKYEIASAGLGTSSLDVGSADIMSGADKQSVFRMGIAYMRPDVIICDELFPQDISVIARAAHCGISVIATVHARDHADFVKKTEYADVISSGVFDCFAVISAPPRRAVTLIEAHHDG